MSHPFCLVGLTGSVSQGRAGRSTLPQDSGRDAVATLPIKGDSGWRLADGNDSTIQLGQHVVLSLPR